MQSYTVSRRRSRIEKRMYSCIMTYPDEGSESKEGQMQSYTVSGRRSRIEKRMYSCIMTYPDEGSES